MDISVVIVTYNSAGQIENCLASLVSQTGVAYEVIVVDNASQDESLARTRQFSQVRVMASPENLGFGRGCNLGFAASTGRYVYLLNPDTRLTDDRALTDVCRSMAAHPQWGMAGTRVRSADGHHEDQPATEYPGQRHVRHDFSKLPGRIAWIIGASMIVRREVFQQIGLLDEKLLPVVGAHAQDTGTAAAPAASDAVRERFVPAPAPASAVGAFLVR